MSLCPSCGLQITGDAAICPHHHYAGGDDWHISNRIWNDLLLRGISPKRLSEEERRDDVWVGTGDVA